MTIKKQIQKNKIVFISFYYWPPHFGGELRIAIDRLEAMAARGYRVVVLTSGVENYPSKEVVNGIQIRRSPTVGFGRVAKRVNRLLFWIWAYLKLVFESNVAVVHVESIVNVLGYIPSHSYASVLLSIANFKKARTLCVHSLASNETNYFQILSKSQFAYLGKYDRIVSVSNALHEAVQKVFPTSAALAVCGIRDDIFRPLTEVEQRSFRQEMGISDSDIVFSFLGSFEKRKGLDLIIEAFLKHNHERKWKLWLVGPYRKEESPYVRENEVAELIAPLGLDNKRVKFWGKIDDRTELARIIGSSDIFLFPTRREGFGIAPLEAMSVGVPVIVSRIPGITDLANIDGVTGLYIEPGNQSQLEQAMIKLAENPELRLSMKDKARVRILENFSWDNYIDHWQEIYFGD